MPLAKQFASKYLTDIYLLSTNYMPGMMIGSALGNTVMFRAVMIYDFSEFIVQALDSNRTSRHVGTCLAG